MCSMVKYVGLDVHKNAMAVAEVGKRAEVREHGEIANPPTARTKLWASSAGSSFIFATRPGHAYTGSSAGGSCWPSCVVVAPLLIPDRPGAANVPTDALDGADC